MSKHNLWSVCVTGRSTTIGYADRQLILADWRGSDFAIRVRSEKGSGKLYSPPVVAVYDGDLSPSPWHMMNIAFGSEAVRGIQSIEAALAFRAILETIPLRIRQAVAGTYRLQWPFAEMIAAEPDFLEYLISTDSGGRQIALSVVSALVSPIGNEFKAKVVGERILYDPPHFVPAFVPFFSGKAARMIMNEPPEQLLATSYGVKNTSRAMKLLGMIGTEPMLTSGYNELFRVVDNDDAFIIYDKWEADTWSRLSELGFKTRRLPTLSGRPRIHRHIARCGHSRHCGWPPPAQIS